MVTLFTNALNFGTHSGVESDGVSRLALPAERPLPVLPTGVVHVGKVPAGQRVSVTVTSGTELDGELPRWDVINQF